MAEIDDVKEQVAVANRILAELGLAAGITASLGHASMRVPSDAGKFVVKGRGYRIDALAKMTAAEGEPSRSRRGTGPGSWTKRAVTGDMPPEFRRGILRAPPSEGVWRIKSRGRRWSAVSKGGRP